MAAKFIAHDKLADWLADLAAKRRVLVPVMEKNAVVFRAYKPGVAMELSRQAHQPPKAAVFPASEPLLRFEYVKNPEDLGQVAVNITETVSSEPTVVFGGRPCDARGFHTFDRVYDNDTVRDPYYAARRADTLFITQSCEAPENTCFCNWTGSCPSDARGSDVMITPVTGGYLVEEASERGKELMASKALGKASKKLSDEAQAARMACIEAQGQGFDPKDAPARLLEKFGDNAFWEEMSAKCISCGACTYLCPTCYCFNVTDERSGMKGERIRSWDNCMSHQFTLEASGHNPRSTKAQRLKNRIGHKFSYYPKIHAGAIACVGCGRCIRLCPVGVDIREIVREAVLRPASTPEKK